MQVFEEIFESDRLTSRYDLMPSVLFSPLTLFFEGLGGEMRSMSLICVTPRRSMSLSCELGVIAWRRAAMASRT